jgi:FkbM family methyltransferase
LEQGFVVHAFEPDPVAGAVLNARYGANRLLTIHPAAVGASARTQVLHRIGEGTIQHSQASSLVFRPDIGHLTGIEVPVVDLFAFLRSLDRPIDVLKLDIEGAEAEILERMLDERVHATVGRVYVETHEAASPELAVRLPAIRNRIRDSEIDNIDLGWM